MIVPRCWASPHSSFWQRHLYLLYFPWSQPAPEHFVTFSWRAISGSVQVEGGAKNETLDGTFALEVTADRSYDLENATFENGADRWEHRVTVEVDNLAVYAKKAMDTVTK